MADTIASLVAEVGINASAFQQGMRSVREELGNASKSLIDFGGRMTAQFTLPIVAGLAAVLKAASDSQTVIAQLNAVLKSTGGIAGVTAAAATDLASSLQKVTRFDDEAILSAENMLLTFTKIGKDVFPEATRTALDMSTALGQDLKSSSIQLGKALNDPINGITALRRVGVTFSAEQERQIKNFMSTNQLAKAQALILKELQTEFGGSAEAAGNTFAGSLDKLKNSIGDLFESIGNALMPAIQGVTDFLTGLVQSLQTVDPAFIQVAAAVALALAAIGPLSVALGVLLSPVGLIIAAVGALLLAFQTNFGGIRDFVGGIWSGISGPIKQIGDAIQGAINILRGTPDLGQAITVTGQQGPAAAAGQTTNLGTGARQNTGPSAPMSGIAQVANEGAATTFVDRFISAIADAGPKIVSAVSDLINKAVTWLTTDGLKLAGDAFKALLDLGTAVADLLPGVPIFIGQLIDKIKNWISDNGPGLLKSALTTLFGLAGAVADAAPQLALDVGGYLGGVARELISQGGKLLKGALEGLFHLADAIAGYIEGGTMGVDLTNFINGLVNWLVNTGRGFILGALMGLLGIDKAGAEAKLKEWTDKIGQWFTDNLTGPNGVLTKIKEAFENLFGPKGPIASVVHSIITTIDGIKTSIQNAINKLLEFMGLQGSGPKPPGSINGPGDFGRAVGGPVGAGMPYIVGERGPELFVPSASGTIIPNSALSTGRSGGNTSSLNINNLNMNGIMNVGDLLDELEREARRRNMKVLNAV